MPLTDPQKTWLQELTGSVAKKEKADKVRDLKSTALTSVRSEVVGLQEELTKQFTFDVKKKRSILPNKKQKSIDQGGDQVEEFDVDEVKDGYWFVTDEEYATPEGKEKADKALERIMKGHESLEAMRKKLEAVTYKDEKGNDVRAFTDEEIGEELYKPLVRSRAMPETLVPDRFSETQKMLEGTYEAYKKKVDAAGEEPGFFARAKGALGATVDDTIGGDGQIVGVTEYLLDNLTTKATTLGVDSDNPSLMSHLGPLKDQQTSGNALFEHVKNAPIDTGNVSDFMALSGMVEVVDMGMTAITKGRAIVQAKSNKSTEPQPLPAKPLAASVVGYISGAIESGVRAAIPQGDDFKLVPKNLSKAFATKADFTKIAGMLVAKKEEKEKEKEKEQKESIKKAAESLGKAIADSFKACGLIPEGPKAQQAFVAAVKVDDVWNAIVKRNQAGVCNVFAQAVFAAIAAVKDDLNKMDANKAAVVTTGLAQVQDDAIKAEMASLPGKDRDKDEDLKKLSQVEAEQNAEKYVGVIERKAKDIEAANASMELAVKLVSGGAAALATLFEPLAAAGALVKFIANMKHMIDRASDAIAWLENQEDLLKACSPYSQAAKNFTHNQRVHSVHYGINAGLELLKMAAAISGCTGMDMGAGKALGTVLAGMSVAEGAIYKAKMKWDLEAGYKAFVKASKNPKSRKAGLKGLIKNPTLAKYSIAWGAYEKKDPLAVHAISSAGLNEKDLEDEDAGLEKVVEYLQTRYPEDNVILRKLATVSWSPGKIELTLRCWTQTKAQAQRAADLAAEPHTAEIECALLDAVGGKKALDDAKEKSESQFADALDAFLVLENALRSYTPKTNANKHHEAMYNVALAFAAAAKKEAAAIEKTREKWLKEDTKWKPVAKVELNWEAWSNIHHEAEQNAGLKKDSGKIVAAALKSYDEANAALTNKGDKAVQGDYLAAIKAVDKVATAVRAYKPQKTDGKPHADMQLIAAKFAALARARAKALSAESDKLFPPS